MGTIIRRRPVQLSIRLINAVAVPAQSMVSPGPDVAVLTGVPTGASGAFDRIGLGSCGHHVKSLPADFPITLSRARDEPNNPWHARP
jgi:hypothetical protein